ncbi:VWA domain-containing protein [Candidatus Woesearchaeota archaeon]|mgnify:CR=1 FL=1|jgi:Mg-chelatase subunit ChlD|nr:VWA domain-containing protein [Candidatus Woesearchaeota archaeon]MBT6519613.1 VWA domain-containing protein [Candidatus Woesearchaeota archaeon]MBT7367528.1 VWA domain-containing protein [Candidatus Woesearchaeota archaeon]
MLGSLGSLDSKEDETPPPEVNEVEHIEELSGKMKFNELGEGFMHSVMENDKQTIDQGKIIEESMNQGISSFAPDLMMERFVNNYQMAKKIFGPSLIMQSTGYDSEYIEKNIQIPEFQRELKKKLKETFDKLKFNKLIDKEGLITEKGIELAALVLYTTELDNIIPKGIHGDHSHKKSYIYGDKGDIKIFKKGDRYKDIAIKSSVKTAIRRGHKNLEVQDLKSFERKSKGEVYLVYALDASGSMKGDKVSTCKKAGVALAYKAIQEKDSVGLLVFGADIKHQVLPTKEFGTILKSITKIKASTETNLAASINHSISMFPNQDVTKHLLLLSDALPTSGEDPEQDTLKAVSAARANNITTSIVGINIDEKGTALGEKIAEIGGGKFYIVRNLDDLNKIVLEDYHSVS